jgi:PAS domain S-box-containing protein
MMDEHDLHEELGRTLADRLIGERHTVALAHLLLLVIVMALAWGALPTGVAAVWAVAVLSATLVRLVLWSRARTLPALPATAVATARTTMTALGLAWGLGTAVAAQYLPLLTVVLTLMGLAGLLAGAVATLVADRWAFKLFLGAMLGPALAGILLLEHRRLENATLVLILAFAGFMWREHERAYGTLVQGLRTERRLRNRERQLAEAQAIAHVGSWEWDIATRAVTWSDEQCRLFGIPIGSAASYEGFVARVHPDDRDRVERIVAQGLAERRTEEYEWRLVRSDGAIRHMYTVSVVVTDAAGKPVRMAGTSVDITDRKMAEENQQALLRELQTALAEVKTLQGLIKICATCKRVLTDEGNWQQFESYVRGHSAVEFSHGICPECARKWAADVG